MLIRLKVWFFFQNMHKASNMFFYVMPRSYIFDIKYLAICYYFLMIQGIKNTEITLKFCVRDGNK